MNRCIYPWKSSQHSRWTIAYLCIRSLASQTINNFFPWLYQQIAYYLARIIAIHYSSAKTKYFTYVLRSRDKQTTVTDDAAMAAEAIHGRRVNPNMEKAPETKEVNKYWENVTRPWSLRCVYRSGGEYTYPMTWTSLIGTPSQQLGWWRWWWIDV